MSPPSPLKIVCVGEGSKGNSHLNVVKEGVYGSVR